MNRNHIKQLNKKIDKILNSKTLKVFPIMGGLSTDPSMLSRKITPQEAEILRNKGVPVPICIALEREQEFLTYLQDDYNNKA